MLYCSHNGWSDIALATLLSWDYFRLRRSFFFLSPQQLEHLRILRFLGARVVPWDNATRFQQVASEHLRPLLQNPLSVLWIFATGDFLSLGETETFWYCTDILHSAQHGLAMAPVVWSYDLLQQEPCCYLWIGEPQLYTPQTASSLLVQQCSLRLIELYDRQQQVLLSGKPPSEYETYSLSRR